MVTELIKDISVPSVLRRLRETARNAESAIIQPAKISDPTMTVLAHPQTRLVHKTDRKNPRAEQREIISLQMKINDIVAQIKAYSSEYRVNHNEASNKQITDSLADLYKSINVDLDHSNMSALEIKDQSDFIRQELKETQARFRELGKDAKHNQERARLNLSAIESYKYLIKLQLKLAQLKLVSSTNPLFDSQVALRFLANAKNNGDLLIRELNWRKNRVDASSKIREIETLDFLGQTIWGINLNNLDINIGPGTTTIRQQIWINPRARITSIIKDLKNSDTATAREKIQDLISIYSSATALIQETKEISEQLKALDQYIQEHPAHITETDVLKEIKAKVAAIKKLIPGNESYPIQKDIEYSKDWAAGLRSRIYVLQGNHEDFITVAKALAHIEDLSLLLSMAANKGSLSKINKKIIDQDLNDLLEWTQRGDVYPKQFAESHLKHIPGIIENGFATQRLDPSQATKHYETAAVALEKAAQELSPRLRDLVRISAGTKNKLDMIYIGLKDADIQGRASLISNLFKEKKYAEALEQIQAVKAQYFSFLFPEPGYMRASESLNKLEDCVRRAVKNDKAELQNEVKYLSDLIVADIEHKNQLRLTVVDLDDDQPYKKYVFPNQGITAQGLARWLGKKYISTGNGLKPLTDGSVNKKLQDLNTQTILVASAMPTKTKSIEPGYPRLQAS